AIKLTDDLVLFIAQNVRSNIRRLEGALVRSLSYASLTGRSLTLDALRHLLRDILDQEQQEVITLDQIQRTVAEHYDVRMADMSSKRRPRAVAVPRQVAMFLCRRITRSSLPDIANAFGKTHATVLHACRTIETRMDVDERLRSSVTQISRKLGAGVSVENRVDGL
ncbi:MAG: chromosomal replication initiator protein DnaA, partial [Deltaproteobacteria bacterium]|nr:chromosomal replication initiator protein DnaA [Deltaproteobacteria bacterium]